MPSCERILTLNNIYDPLYVPQFSLKSVAPEVKNPHLNFLHLPINNNRDINWKKSEVEAPILTVEDFVLQYEHLTNTSKPGAPFTFIS